MHRCDVGVGMVEIDFGQRGGRVHLEHRDDAIKLHRPVGRRPQLTSTRRTTAFPRRESVPQREFEFGILFYRIPPAHRVLETPTEFVITEKRRDECACSHVLIVMRSSPLCDEIDAFIDREMFVDEKGGRKRRMNRLIALNDGVGAGHDFIARLVGRLADEVGRCRGRESGHLKLNLPKPLPPWVKRELPGRIIEPLTGAPSATT